jgi:predicted enzyme related to lactoylglutathione lyase
MPRVIHFEINADEPARAAEFYRGVFGWKVQKWEGPIDYWLITTGPSDEPGIDGALVRRTAPNANIWNTIEVPSVDDYVARVLEAGGALVMPKQTIPGIGYQAYCRDPEGNVFGLYQADSSAG